MVHSVTVTVFFDISVICDYYILLNSENFQENVIIVDIVSQKECYMRTFPKPCY